jgi:WS/DGAT/MGAT family acyltransferase
MSVSVDAVGLPRDLGALDYLFHRGEANPRTRSGILAVEILDTAPVWARFQSTFEHASREVPRLRQKVVVPSIPTAAPRWVIDPDFDLGYHLRRVRVPEPATLRQVFALAEVMLQSPLDLSRPLWTATLVEGLADGRAALVMHMSHVVADGVGSVQMFAHLYDLERDPPRRPVPMPPVPEDLSPHDLMLAGIGRLPGAVVGRVGWALSGALQATGRAVREPVSSVGDVVGYLRSGSRVLSPAAEPSPLLRRRSLASRSEAIDMDFSDFRSAAKAAGGSINDAYIAGLCGALRRYHEAKHVPIETMSIAIPVNLRSENDPTGGNRFGGVTLAAPVGEPDAAARIKDIHAQMGQRREERAIGVLGAIAPLLSLLPSPLLDSAVASIVASDVQASNVPVYPGDTYIAGAKVLRQYGFGPLPGVAMMAVLVSRGGMFTLTVRYDRASVSDEALFAQCLLDGFDEVLALGGPDNGCAVAASFMPNNQPQLSSPARRAGVAEISVGAATARR